MDECCWSHHQARGGRTIQRSFEDDKDVLKCTEELHAAEAGFCGLVAQLDTAMKKEGKVFTGAEFKVSLYL